MERWLIWFAASLLSGCSLTAMQRLPDRPPTEPLAVCSTSSMAPVVDTVMVVPSLVVVAAGAQSGEGTHGNGLAVVAGIGAAVVFAISAMTGFEASTRCETYHADMQLRALRDARQAGPPGARPR